MATARRVVWIVVGLVVLLSGLIAVSAHLVTDWWWFQELGHGGLFIRLLAWPWVVRLGAAVLFAALIYVNLSLTRQALARAMFRFQGRAPVVLSWRLMRRVLLFGSAVLGLLSAEALAQNWLLIARFWHRTSFGVADPLFGRDIGFYVFEAPFYRLVNGSLAGILFVTTLSVLLVYLVARTVERRGREVFLDEGPRRHLLALVAGMVLLKALDYRLRLYNVLFSTTSDVIYGATYTDWHARVLAWRVLFVAALAFAATLLASWKRMQWRWLAGVGAAWVAAAVLLGQVYPAALQRFIVEPNELEREQPFIEHHLAFTRLAYGLDAIEKRPFVVDNHLTWQRLADYPHIVENARLWDWRPLARSYAQLQSIRFYYTFPDVDVDRYVIDGRLRQVMLAVRELDLSQIPNRTWVNQHLQYTHGYGLVMSPVAEVTPQGLPRFLLADIPPRPRDADLVVERPEIYYGELTDQYVVVGTRTPDFEFSYPSGDDNVRTTYRGTGGVPLSSIFRRAAFAARFQTVNLLLSDEITSSTRILFRRNVMERLQTLAPFLRFDSDPYAVLADGRLFWIVDAYTTASGFPYAMPHPRWQANYVRNAVKAVVDAYNGTVHFYVFDPGDPLIRVYTGLFPGLFEPAEAMPESLRAHVRYPEDLFQLQAEVLALYHMDNPTVFYNREDVWRPAREVFSSDASGQTREQVMSPYYAIVQLPDRGEPEMVLMLPFTPTERNNMIAWFAARMDGDDYGRLLLYEFPKDVLIYGPMQIEARIDQHPDISQLLTLWAQRGSQVIRGNMLVLPIEQSLLYLKPIYLQAETGDLPELVRVIVAFGDQIAMHQTLAGALQAVLPGGTVASQGTSLAGFPPGTEVTPESPQPGGVAGAAAAAQQALASEALRLYEEARARLAQGDWAGYGAALEQLELILRQLAAEP
ncbi:MAG: hypothetical protein BAA04_11135 [Firmicutes bacterium ZCTH02-B6]|nr:MAG: hypothetical protein BAA04_11135 [Firmicutes bacterium ZCTH02-B6]